MDSLDVEVKTSVAKNIETASLDNSVAEEEKAQKPARINATATSHYITVINHSKGLLCEGQARTYTQLSVNLNEYLKDPECLDVPNKDEDSAQLGHYRKLTTQVINRDPALQEKVAQDLSSSHQLVRSRDASAELEKSLKQLPDALSEGTPAGKNLSKFICQSVVNLTDYENMGAGLQRDLSIRQVYPPAQEMSLRQRNATADALSASIAYVKSNQPEVLASIKEEQKVEKTPAGTTTPQIMTRYLRQALEEFPEDSTYLDIFKQNRDRSKTAAEGIPEEDKISQETSRRIRDVIMKAAISARKGNLIEGAPRSSAAPESASAPVKEAPELSRAEDSSIDASKLSLSELSARAAKLQQQFREDRIRLVSEGKLPDPASPPPQLKIQTETDSEQISQNENAEDQELSRIREQIVKARQQYESSPLSEPRDEEALEVKTQRQPLFSKEELKEVFKDEIRQAVKEALLKEKETLNSLKNEKADISGNFSRAEFSSLKGSFTNNYQSIYPLQPNKAGSGAGILDNANTAVLQDLSEITTQDKITKQINELDQNSFNKAQENTEDAFAQKQNTQAKADIPELSKNVQPQAAAESVNQASENEALLRLEDDIQDQDDIKITQEKATQVSVSENESAMAKSNEETEKEAAPKAVNTQIKDTFSENASAIASADTDESPSLRPSYLSDKLNAQQKQILQSETASYAGEEEPAQNLALSDEELPVTDSDDAIETDETKVISEDLSLNQEENKAEQAVKTAALENELRISDSEHAPENEENKISSDKSKNELTEAQKQILKSETSLEQTSAFAISGKSELSDEQITVKFDSSVSEKAAAAIHAESSEEKAENTVETENNQAEEVTEEEKAAELEKLVEEDIEDKVVESIVKAPIVSESVLVSDTDTNNSTAKSSETASLSAAQKELIESETKTYSSEDDLDTLTLAPDPDEDEGFEQSASVKTDDSDAEKSAKEPSVKNVSKEQILSEEISAPSADIASEDELTAADDTNELRADKAEAVSETDISGTQNIEADSEYASVQTSAAATSLYSTDDQTENISSENLNVNMTSVSAGSQSLNAQSLEHSEIKSFEKEPSAPLPEFARYDNTAQTEDVSDRKEVSDKALASGTAEDEQTETDSTETVQKNEQNAPAKAQAASPDGTQAAQVNSAPQNELTFEQSQTDNTALTEDNLLNLNSGNISSAFIAEDGSGTTVQNQSITVNADGTLNAAVKTEFTAVSAENQHESANNTAAGSAFVENTEHKTDAKPVSTAEPEGITLEQKAQAFSANENAKAQSQSQAASQVQSQTQPQGESPRQTDAVNVQAKSSEQTNANEDHESSAQQEALLKAQMGKPAFLASNSEVARTAQTHNASEQNSAANISSPSSGNGAAAKNDSIGEKILGQTVPSSELEDNFVPSDVKGQSKDLSMLTTANEDETITISNIPDKTPGAAAITQGQSEPIPEKSVVENMTAAKEKSGLFSKIASIFSRKSAPAENRISIEPTMEISNNAPPSTFTPKGSPLDNMLYTLRVQTENAALPQAVRDEAKKFIEELENPIDDLPSVSNWLNFTSGPMSPSSSQALALHQWAFFLLAIRFSQIGKSVDKFLKRNADLMEDRFDKITDEVAKNIGKDQQKVIPSLIDETFDQVVRMQHPQKEGVPSLFQYIPLPPSYEGGREGNFSARPVVEEDGKKSWHLNFVFDLQNLGPIEIKAVAKLPELKLSVIASTFEGLQQIQKALPELRKQLQDLGITTTSSNTRLGKVHIKDSKEEASRSANVNEGSSFSVDI